MSQDKDLSPAALQVLQSRYFSHKRHFYAQNTAAAEAVDNHRIPRYEQQIQRFSRHTDEDFWSDLQDRLVRSAPHQKSYEMS